MDDTPEPIVPKNIFSARLSLDDINELEIARQLTIATHEIFKRITPPELCRRWWTSDDADYKVCATDWPRLSRDFTHPFFFLNTL